MRTYPEYTGLSYEQASREGYLLVNTANKSGDWMRIIDRLAALRTIMNEHFDKAL